MSTSPLSVTWSLTSSWTSGPYIQYQYNVNVLNTGLAAFTQAFIRSTNTAVASSWSATVQPGLPYVFLFPSWVTSLQPSQSYTFGCITNGKTTFVVDSVTTAPTTTNSTTTNTPTTTSPTTTTSTTTTPAAHGIDKFGISMLVPSTSNVDIAREWYCNWTSGSQRNFSFGPAGSTDPELIFRGSGSYIIYGSSGDRAGMMSITGSCPRIYVRNSTLETDQLPSTVKKWGNVEVTFYANTTNPGSSVSYAGIEAVVRTNHYPDDMLCSTRGYGGKINFDGRAQFEKECCHGIGNKQVATTYPFPNKGKMPLNTWIGYKFIARASDNNTKCKLELYMDLTDGLNGGTWVKVTEFVDYDGWSADTPSCCTAHCGKVLLPPAEITNYSVYLRSDGLGEQLYKKFSIREVDPLP